MAKKSSKSDRQAVIDEIRKKQKGSEKRRGLRHRRVSARCVAVLIVVAAAYRPVQELVGPAAVQGHQPGLDRRSGLGVRQGGRPSRPTATSSTCRPARRSPTRPRRRRSARTGTSRASPPRRSTGSSTPTKDRPELEALVHNLEHGYTILWYDAVDRRRRRRSSTSIDGIADKFRSDSDNLRYKFIAAPWTSDDEKESGKFPDGMHVAISHWSAGGYGVDRRPASRSASSSTAAEPSGAALKDVHAGVPLHRLARAGRDVMAAPERIAIVSGYFNPIHIGHLRMIKAARELAPHLVVIVNNDRQQLLKKGRILMTEDDRRRSSPSCAASTRRSWRSTTTARSWRRCGRCASAPGRRAAVLQRRRPLARRRRPERGDPPDRGDRAADGLRRGRRGQGRLEQPDQRGAEPADSPGLSP